MNGRPLTDNEIREARRVFGDRVDYTRPRIFCKRHALAVRPNQILAPDGNIYWPRAPADLIENCEINVVATFIHEMTHVYQYQAGWNVLGRGCLLHLARMLSLGRYNPYAYSYDSDRSFTAYNIEQQAEISVGIYFGWYPNIIPLEGPAARPQVRG